MKVESQLEYLEMPVHFLEEMPFSFSGHATRRMSQRTISQEQVSLVLVYGRLIRSRGACFYVAGRKEVNRCAKEGVDLRSAEGIQVIVDERTNTVLTVYRNRNFRQIRPQHRRERRVH